MTGPEHYREAERVLAGAAAALTELSLTPKARGEVFDRSVATAQVHATLALAAATAEPIAQSYDGPDDTTIPRAWSAAIS